MGHFLTCPTGRANACGTFKRERAAASHFLALAVQNSLSGKPNPENARTEWKAFIRGLCDSDFGTRAESAREIFQRGCELARSAIEPWLADNMLSNLFVRERSGFPEATVGLAVEPSTFELIWKACGSPRLVEVPPDQDAREFELEFPSGVRLDILTTRNREASGALARHLQKFGEGIQQVELLVKNVDHATEILRLHFHLMPIFPATRAGADRTRVNFFLVPATEGKKVLIELVEAGRERK
jgi:hypothetical protein